MKATQRFCEIYLNNRRYTFDATRKVYFSSSGLEPRVVTMDEVERGFVHAALWRTYVVGGVPYYYDEVRNELMRVSNLSARLGVNDYRALMEVGAISAPRGEVFKAIIDRDRVCSKRAQRNEDRER